MRIISAPARLGENWLGHVPVRHTPPQERQLPTEQDLQDWLAAECFTTRPLAVQAKLLSLEWFLEIEARRYSRRSRWLPRLLEFSKHAGETVLGVGDSLGTDWVQYARHGAQVTVCGQKQAMLDVVQSNFRLRAFSATFHQIPCAVRQFALPSGDATVDVACVANFPTGVELAEVAREIDRVLKPGGKLVLVVPASYNVVFWKRTLLLWRRWWERSLSRSSEALRRFSARELRGLFKSYTEVSGYKRQLRRPEVPPVWRWLPLPLLARLMGNVLVFKAFKPLNGTYRSHVSYRSQAGLK
jgi:SAM-dependent methyltransferase